MKAESRCVLLLALLLALLPVPDRAVSAAESSAEQAPWALWRDLSRAHRCNALRLLLGPKLPCHQVSPPASTGTLLADALALAYGDNNPPVAAVRDRELRSQRHCQTMIGAAVARFVGLGLVLQERGLPQERAEKVLRRVLGPIESYCRVTVRESRRGVVLPSVGAQCAAAVGEPGDSVDPQLLRSCLESLLSYWVNRSGSSPEPLRPNFVLILTDDQRWDTLDTTHSPDADPVMPAVLDQLADSGMEFTQAFVTTPACAPSRASIMTGQYAHNHGVVRNGGDFGAPVFDDSSTLATWLQDAGYRTGFFGKYLNSYSKLWQARVERPYVPPGWHDWRAFNSSGQGVYFNYSMVENGWIVAYGDDEADYSTDVISQQALSFIDAAVGEGQPFFVTYSPSAPHFPYMPAPRHLGAFWSLASWAPPSMLEPDVSDKPGWVRALPFTLESFLRAMKVRRRQLAMLQAVDEFVDDLMERLREHGVEDDTLVVFSSDNGMTWGEHRHVSKACGYEECLRVPLVVRYPRLVPLPRQSSSMALNVDLAPTLAELAGAHPSPATDGRSLVRVLDGTDRQPRDDFFFETFAWPNLYFAGVREAGWKYVEYQYGEQELYDLVSDPYELENIAHAPESAERLARMQLRLLEFEPDWLYMP